VISTADVPWQDWEATRDAAAHALAATAPWLPPDCVAAILQAGRTGMDRVRAESARLELMRVRCGAGSVHACAIPALAFVLIGGVNLRRRARTQERKFMKDALNQNMLRDISLCEH
jgi:hypothetical protein